MPVPSKTINGVLQEVGPYCEAQSVLTTSRLKFYCRAVQKKQGEHATIAIQTVLLQQL